MSAFHDNALLGASGQQGYKISRSVRFRQSASAYFNRTLTTPTNNKIWTWSGWVKRGILVDGTTQRLFTANGLDSIFFGTYDATEGYIAIYLNGAASGTLITTARYRDPSAWYHFVIAFDTTQATAANRVKIYVNGVQVTAFSTATYPSQNYNTAINSAVSHTIGNFVSANYFDGYMTEINFVDGQQLTPSSFGETNATTGVWQPKAYTGTYGTNGFELNFSDNSNNTAATIGKDYSGNGNNWTPNNISVTAGVTYDSMVDSPTVGATSSNYPVLNPIYKGYGGYTATPVTISNANLTATGNASANNIAATIALPTTGQFYYEYVWTANSGGEMDGGIIGETGTVYFYRYDGTYWNGSSYVSYGASYTTNDVIGVAVDMTNLTFTFYKNGVSQGTKTSAFPSGVNYFPWFYLSNTVAASVNFGQRPFSYTPPTGFVALNTQNLPTPTISNGANYMAATLYTGTGATQSITNSAGFAPDLVWIKDRSAARSHRLFDTVRGATKALFSDATDAETTLATDLTAFNSNGFTLGAGLGSNANTETFVGWQWKANGTAVSNTSGSITSTVSAGATQGFSVVTYTGTGANATVGHGLGVAPRMVITKVRSTANDWGVYHSGINDPSKALLLDSTAAAASYGGATGMWNNTAPTSTVFSVGTNGSTGGSATYVAYCFAEVAGYSKFGSYTGNGSADGPFVFLGFRPRFLLLKSSSAINSWAMYDTSRSTSNTSTARLYADSSAAETTGLQIDVLSNGFKWREAGGQGNDSGATYIFAAFAENPFKNSLAR